MGPFGREPKPIRKIRFELEALPIMWKVHGTLPDANRRQAEHAMRASIRGHAKAAAAGGHRALAVEVLTSARANPPADEQAPGLHWDDVIDEGLAALA